MKRAARYVCLSLLLAVVALAANWRIRNYILVRRISAVLAGLEKVRIDQTSEDQLLKTVPGFIPYDRNRDGSARGYLVRISNEDEWFWWLWHMPLASFGAGFRGDPIPDLSPWSLPYSARIGYWLGLRYVKFEGWVYVQDGVVSGIGYGLSPDLLLYAHHNQGVSARSFHSIPRWQPPAIASTDDESPDYRVYGHEKGLHVLYAANTAPELTSHALRLDLSCFYLSIRGCQAARDIAPQVWRDKQDIEARTAARLRNSGNACPDRILAGRMRYLPVKVEQIGNELSFTGVNFESCQTVAATPSALATVRTIAPSPKRSEDDRLIPN